MKGESRTLQTGHTVVGPVLLIGRASSPGGKKAYRLAALDLLGAARALAKVGIDCSSHLPTEEELVDRLRHATPVRSAVDGEVFINRYVDIDLTDACGVYAVLSVGTGKKVNDEFVQPFVGYCGEVAKLVRPGLTFGKRFDRLARNAWGLAPLMQVVNSIPGALVGDEKKGIWPSGAMTDMLVFFETRVGEEEAEKMPLKTRRGMKDGTAEGMVDGQALFGLAASVPAGFGRVRLLAGGGVGRPLLFVDSPQYRPNPATVAHGLPRVFDETGAPVDQAANVRWALSSFAAGMTYEGVAAGLVERRFSTDLLRLRRGLDATHLPTTVPRNMVTPILDRLDLYETGTLTYASGVDEIGDITVSNCFPPQGEWATPAEFAAIRDRLAHGVRRFSQRTKRTFVGLQVSDGDGTYTMRHYRGTHYSLRARVGQDGRPTPGLVIPHGELAAMIRDAVISAGVRLIEAVDTAPVKGTAGDRSRIVELNHRLAHLEARRDRVLEELDETDSDGNRTITGPLLQHRNTLFSELVEQIDETRSEIASHERQIAALRRRADERKHQARTDQLLEIVASLRDPSDLTYRKLWADTVSDLTISSVPVRAAGLRGRRITLTGDFTFRDGADRFTVPMRRQYALGAVTTIDSRVDEIIRQMCDGVPVRSIPASKALLGRVAERLGSSNLTFYAARIDDPTLLRLVMATVYIRGGRSNTEIADELGLTVELVERVESVHKTFSGMAKVSFVHCGMQERVVALYVAASRNGGLITPELVVPAVSDSWDKVSNALRSRTRSDEWRVASDRLGRRLDPCAGCGSFRRAPTGMIFIKGLLCLDCLHDTGGLRWGTAHLRYVQHPGLWGLDPGGS